MRPWLDANRDFSMAISTAIWKKLRLEDSDSFRNFLRMEPAMFDQTKVSQAEHLVPASNWTWPKNDSSAICAGYLNAVVTPH